MLWLEFAKGIMLVQKYPKLLPTKRTTVGLFVCFSSFSFGRAWFKRGSLDPHKSKSENSNMFLKYEGWFVHSMRSGQQELEKFSKKEVKTVLGKERVFIVMWTHIQKITKDPKYQNWGWITRWAPSFVFLSFSVLWETQQCPSLGIILIPSLPSVLSAC